MAEMEGKEEGMMDPRRIGPLAFFFLVLFMVSLFLMMTGCTSLGNRVASAVGDEIVHDTRSFRGLEKRIDLLEKSEAHTKVEIEQHKSSAHYMNKIMDRRLERIETALDSKLERIIGMEEKILGLLTDRRTGKL